LFCFFKFIKLLNQIRLWARSELIDEGFAEDTIQMATQILNKLEEIFKEILTALPNKIGINIRFRSNSFYR